MGGYLRYLDKENLQQCGESWESRGLVERGKRRIKWGTSAIGSTIKENKNKKAFKEKNERKSSYKR